MALFVGIDGGGSLCRAAICDAQGRIVGRGQSGPANINTDPEAAARNILIATDAALAGTGAARGDLIAGLGLAGGSLAQARDRLHQLLPFTRLVIVNDAETALRGALGSRDGIVAAIGTGSVFARQRGGRIGQYGGHGFVLGDEGGGAALGRSLLARALHAADGFVPMTPLLRAMLARFGGVGGIIAFANSAPPADFAALVPQMLDIEDDAAAAILADSVRYIRHALQSLQAGPALPVVFLGGLGPFYAARLQGPWPILAPRGNALDGALAMARELGRHDPGARAR